MKLIRDKIHEKIQDGNRPFQLERMNTASLAICLKDKLEEETQEVVTATDDELLEELADVYEVIRTLCVLSGHSIGALHDMADLKRAESGGFLGRWFLNVDPKK